MAGFWLTSGFFLTFRAEETGLRATGREGSSPSQRQEQSRPTGGRRALWAVRKLRPGSLFL